MSKPTCTICGCEITVCEWAFGGNCKYCRERVANAKIERVKDWKNWREVERIENEIEKELRNERG